MQIHVIKLPHAQELPMPSYATDGSAGMDLVAAIEEEIIIKPGEVKLIPTGLAFALPIGFEAQIRPRSGISLKHQVIVLNTPGTIDSDYRGEVKIMLYNLGQQDFIVSRGLRIAQMIIARYEKISWQEVETLTDSVRGEGGFGSTGTESKILSNA